MVALFVSVVSSFTGSPVIAVALHVALLISIVAHNITYFFLVGQTGAVSTGIIQALRAVSVFAISSLLFCDIQESQCFNGYKGVSSFIVIGGTLLFGWATAQRQVASHKQP